MSFVSLASEFFSVKLVAPLDETSEVLPVSSDDAARICELLGSNCGSCWPEESPAEPEAINYTRLVISTSQEEFEIVKVTSCNQGVPMIERGQEGTEPVAFPAGACVQYSWTTANVVDFIKQTCPGCQPV